MLMIVGGCQPVSVKEPLTRSLAGNQGSDQLEFWHSLPDRPVACNDEAFHALLLYLDGRDESQGYEARVSRLKNRQLLPQAFDEPGDRAVSRGTLAVALVRILHIHGGWVMTLLGPSPRYATRELVYRGIYPPSSPEQTFSGNELVGLIGKLEDTQQAGNQQAAASTIRPGGLPSGGGVPIEGAGLPR